MFLPPGLSTGWLRSGPWTNRSPLVRPCDTEMWYYAGIFGGAKVNVGSRWFIGLPMKTRVMTR